MKRAPAAGRKAGPGGRVGQRALVARHRVTDGHGFRLSRHDPGDTGGVRDRDEASVRLGAAREQLHELQEKLYATDRWAVLIVLQGMDAAGKDGVIKHVLSAVNPQGCQVSSFKAPHAEELDHDFLWRTTRALPERGRIGIFNRSYYEEVLVVRVHPELLAGQRLPERLVGLRLWDERFESIRAHERHLARNGTLVLKFFLNISRDEQRRRFLDRIDEPAKNWKFSQRDVEERRHWTRYMHAYEQAIRATAAPHAPWIVVPADAKWYARLVVAATLVEALEELDLAFPRLSATQKRELTLARRSLERR